MEAGEAEPIIAECAFCSKAIEIAPEDRLAVLKCPHCNRRIKLEQGPLSRRAPSRRILFACPKCGVGLDVAFGLRHQNLECPKCAQKVRPARLAVMWAEAAERMLAAWQELAAELRNAWGKSPPQEDGRNPCHPARAASEQYEYEPAGTASEDYPRDFSGGSQGPAAPASANSARLLRPAIPAEVRQAITAAQPNDVGVQALREAVRIEEHLQFAEALLRKYKWDSQTHDVVRARLTEIKSREDDPRLFLGVVGEFSSGKSTLINALIRDELLRMDVLQGTTTAATVLSYGPEVDVQVTFTDGQFETYRLHGQTLWRRFARWASDAQPGEARDTIRWFIHRYTAEQETAQRVSVVNIFHPTQAFHNGLVIVDTPGTNTDNPHHAKVTGQALRDICDAAVVVISADVPCPETLLAFLRTHLSDVLHRCVFILNKMDTVRRDSERERLLATVSAVLVRELGIPNPVVLPAAPQIVLDALAEGRQEQSGPSNESRRIFVSQFEQTERFLQGFLETHRTLILSERLSLCLSALLEQLQARLESAAEVYRKRHEALAQNRIPNLAAFVAQQKSHHLAEFRSRACLDTRGLAECVRQYREEVVRVVCNDITNAQSTTALKKVVDEHTKHYMRWAQGELHRRLAAFRDAIRMAAESQHTSFKSTFMSLYKSLAALDGLVRVPDLGVSGSQSLTIQVAGQTQVVVRDLQNVVNQEGWAVGIGLAVGTLVFPGIGTAVGAFVGGLLESIFGPPLDDLKREAQSDVVGGIRNSFDVFEQTAVQNVDGAVEQTGNALCRIIDRYFQIYQTKVEELTRREEEEKSRLASVRRVIEEDLAELRGRREHIERIRERLRTRQRATYNDSQK